jgi:cytochrome P450
MRYNYPPGFSFFGTYERAIRLVKNPIEGMSESMVKFGDTYSVFSGFSKRIILTKDPEFIEFVLKKNHRNYHKSRMVSHKLGRFIGNGLLTSNGAYWLKQRRLIQPGFHHQKIQRLYSVMEMVTNDFLESIPTGKEIAVLPLMNQLAFKMVIKTLFAVDIPETSIDELGNFITDIQEFVVRDIRQPHKSWWHSLSGEVDRNIVRAKSARNILLEIIRQRQASTEKFDDLLDMLLQARYEDSGEGMTEEQIIDEILILLIAGHETIANALSWSLYLLATYPAEMEKLKRATTGLSLQDKVMNEQAIAVVNESMRLYPPAWVSDRVALEADSFKGFTFPAETVIILFYYGLHRDERFWKDPNEFKPDRFLKNALEKNPVSGIFYPFGGGPRLCIGNNFALAEMSLFIQAFIHKFNVLPTATIPSMKPQVTLRPEGILLTIRKT